MNKSAGRRWARPVRPVVPVLSSAAVLLAWGLVAHNSGAGWVQAIGDALAGTLVVGLLGPAVVVHRARVSIASSPADGTAGLPIELAAKTSSRLRVKPVDPGGPTSFVGPRRGARVTDARVTDDRSTEDPSTDDRVALVPAHRGAYEAIVVEVASAAPFGILWWTRRLVLPMPRELVIAPRLGEAESLPSRREEGDGEAARRTAARVGEPRGARPYRAGDLRRAVHWPATAHIGDLMVRETEGPASASAAVEVHLPADTDAAERTAERAFGTVVALLDRVSAVALTTTESSGVTCAVVTDRRTAGRRLARAVGERHMPPGIAIQPAAGASPVVAR